MKSRPGEHDTHDCRFGRWSAVERYPTGFFVLESHGIDCYMIPPLRALGRNSEGKNSFKIPQRHEKRTPAYLIRNAHSEWPQVSPLLCHVVFVAVHSIRQTHFLCRKRLVSFPFLFSPYLPASRRCLSHQHVYRACSFRVTISSRAQGMK